jgi:tetratricopeptide (TPR) repeat protein
MDFDSISALNKAETLLKSGDIQAAQALLIRALKSNPTLVQGWYLLSFTLQETEQKRFALLKAINIHPEFEQAVDALNKLDSTGRIQPLSTDETLIKPPESESALHRAQKLIKAQKLEAAQIHLVNYIKKDPNNSQAWYLLSYTEATTRGKINDLRQALRIQPHFPSAENRLNELSKESNKYQWHTSKQPPKSPDTEDLGKKAPSTFWGLAHYITKRGLVILTTIIVGIYLTVLITAALQRRISRFIR